MRCWAILPTMVFLAASVAVAVDIATNTDMSAGALSGANARDHARSEILVVSVAAGLCLDLGPTYQQAFTDLGYDTDLYYHPGDWPDLNEYTFVLVDFSDLRSTGYWSANDEVVLANYINEGGLLILVGQDYLSIRGTDLTFPQLYLGVGGYSVDVNAGASALDWSGTLGGPLETYSGTISACFEPRVWYTDRIVPSGMGLMMWRSEGMPDPVEGGSATASAIFSSIEIGCAEDLRELLRQLLDHLGVYTPVEEVSWGRLKVLYR